MKKIILALVVLSTIACKAQPNNTPADALNKNIQSYLAARNRMVPLNAAVLITRNDKVIAQQFFGYRDKAGNLPIDRSTVFPIASSTKSFTATAVMMLFEKGKLTLEDPITKWIKGIPAQWKSVTVKHLLSHTSGIPDIFKMVSNDRFGSDLPAVVNVYKTAALQFTPGEKYNYNNANYIFLGFIIDKVSGQSYESFIQENIFNPLQMKSTGFAYLYKGNSMAKSYGDAFVMNPPPSGEKANLQLLRGAGGMYSNTEDLSRFLTGLRKLLLPKTMTLMITPVKGDYALGWHVQEQFGKTTIKHPGGINGYVSEMRYVPADSTSVIILSNIRANDLNIRYTAFDIMKLMNNVPLEVDTSINVAYIGKYRLPKEIAERAKSSHLEIVNNDGRMGLVIPGQPVKHLVPFSKGKYFFYGEATDAEFSIDGKELTIISPAMGRIRCVKE